MAQLCIGCRKRTAAGASEGYTQKDTVMSPAAMHTVLRSDSTRPMRSSTCTTTPAPTLHSHNVSLCREIDGEVV